MTIDGRRVNLKSCPLCNTEAELRSIPGRIAYQVACRTCKEFVISAEAIHARDAWNDKAFILSALARQKADDDKLLELTEEGIQDLLKSTRVPDEEEARHRILLYVQRHAKHAGGYVHLDAYHDYPIAFAKNRDEFVYHLQTLRDTLKYLENPGDGRYRLTPAGFDYLKRGKVSRNSTNQAFVAMWFENALDPIWRDGFAPALAEVGYKPFRMKELEHNGKIDDRLIQEIERSSLVVADFTGHRGSVYYEAGYARAQDIEVISTVRHDEFRDVQFDTRQYNHIVWNDAADLREKLVRRIKGSVLKTTGGLPIG